MRSAGATSPYWRRHPREVLLVALFALYPLSGVVHRWDTFASRPLLLACGVALVVWAVLALTAPTRE